MAGGAVKILETGAALAGAIPADDHPGDVRDFLLQAPDGDLVDGYGTRSHSAWRRVRRVADRLRESAMRASLAGRRSWTKNPFPLLCHRALPAFLHPRAALLRGIMHQTTNS
jgi:hypothetical protein